MFKISIRERVLKAIERSPEGIAELEVLRSIGLCGAGTLKITLSRLGKSGRIVRLKRGTYSVSPMRDAFACAQSVFNGYLGFSTALHLHGLLAEMPFTAHVVTTYKSGRKTFGSHDFLAVSLKEKAVGFERLGKYVVSTRAKTLFDCLYLSEYSVEETKLCAAFREAKLSAGEWRQFGDFVAKFAGKKAAKMKAAKKAILSGMP